MKFSEIPQFVRDGSYTVDVNIGYLDEHIQRFIREYKLNLQPDFQRAHVWTDEQSIKFVEYLLRGGQASRLIYFNHPGWMGTLRGEFVLVDGLQRLTACLKFVRNELPVFGHLCKDFEDRLPLLIGLRFNVNTLRTRREVLQWYLDLNTGGTPHTSEEIEKVRSLLEQEK